MKNNHSSFYLVEGTVFAMIKVNLVHEGTSIHMEVRELDLSSKSGFMKDYIAGSEGSERFLDYSLMDDGRFRRRSDELLSRAFQREQLADYFTSVHTCLSYNKQAMVQIEKLRNSKSVVVVGGQQAGLLTGPLYTVYKAMSIIVLAKQQEEQLGIPVVPIFWIAGEDHDLDEIRYVYREQKGQWKKHMYDELSNAKSASSVKLDRQTLQSWLNDVFASLPETAYTNALIKTLEEFAENSMTYVHFFTRMMNWFFGKEGLLLLDAHDPTIRMLEIPYFEKLIDDVEELQAAQNRGAQAFKKAGYGEPIVTEVENAHLFLDINDERKRLDYQNELFKVRGSDVTFSKKELLALLHAQPERFSNNVISRPLMQEWLLPVLAFVSGPGELLYWATLKDVFNHFDMKIPPIIPRLQATFVPKAIERWLSNSSYKLEPILQGEMEEIREAWLTEVNPFPVHEVASKVRQNIRNEHTPLRKLANEMDPTLAALSEKNLTIIESQLVFLEQKMERFVRETHHHTLSKFNEAGHWLSPLNRPQERIFHPLLLINIIGIDEFQRFISNDVSLEPSHKILYL